MSLPQPVKELQIGGTSPAEAKTIGRARACWRATADEDGHYSFAVAL